MELLGMLLDVIDAVAGVIGFLAFWYTWVAPRRETRPPHATPSEQGEIERFLREAGERSDRRDARA